MYTAPRWVWAVPVMLAVPCSHNHCHHCLTPTWLNLYVWNCQNQRWFFFSGGGVYPIQISRPCSKIIIFHRIQNKNIIYSKLKRWKWECIHHNFETNFFFKYLKQKNNFAFYWILLDEQAHTRILVVLFLCWFAVSLGGPFR